MSGPTRDAVVVGGGPAGLAFAIAAARRGLDGDGARAARRPGDKACGEGILPRRRARARARSASSAPARRGARRAVPRASAGSSGAARRGCGCRRPAGSAFAGRRSRPRSPRARGRRAPRSSRREVRAHRRERDADWALCDRGRSRRARCSSPQTGSARRCGGARGSTLPRRARRATASGATSPCRRGLRRSRCTSARARRRT